MQLSARNHKHHVSKINIIFNRHVSYRQYSLNKILISEKVYVGDKLKMLVTDFRYFQYDIGDQF